MRILKINKNKIVKIIIDLKKNKKPNKDKKKNKKYNKECINYRCFSISKNGITDNF